MGADAIARGLAAQARAAAQPPLLRALGNIGSRLIPGRTYNAAYSQEATYELLIAVPCDAFSAVRVVFATGQTGGATAASVTTTAYVRAVPDATDASSAAAIPKQVTLGGATSWPLAPAPSANRRAYAVSDWITLPSVARGDGGRYPLVVVRAHLTAGQIVVSGNGSDDFGNWAGHPSGLVHRMRHRIAATDYAASGNWANFNASNAAIASSGSPIAGIQYLANGKVVNLFGFGDSITEGRGTYLGEGFGTPAAIALSANGAGIAHNWNNLAWSGQTTPQILQNLKDAIAAGIMPPHAVIVLPSGSPNNVGNRAMTASDISGAAGGVTASAQGDLAQMLAAIALGIPTAQPVLWTWMATNSAVNGYGATDALRRGYNDLVRQMAGRGQIVADIDTALAGTADASGQVQMRGGTTTDGIHPNDAGNALAASVLARAVQRLVQPAAGMLVR
jgi:lysophospholipase L1-like esterase